MTGTADGISSEPLELTADLRRLIKVRTPAGLRDGHFPALLELLPDGVERNADQRVHEIRAALATGIANISDPQFREAAGELLGFEGDRWSPLKDRGNRAAAPFQIGWDAFRRTNKTSGLSLLDQTLRELANSLILEFAPSGSNSPTATTSKIESTNNSTEPPIEVTSLPKRNRTAIIGAAAGLLVALLIGGAVIVFEGGDSKPAEGQTAVASTTTATVTNSTSPPIAISDCPFVVGQLQNEDPVDAAVAKQFVAATIDDPADTCALEPISKWGQLYRQVLQKQGVKAGALLSEGPLTPVLRMSRTEYAGYFQTGGKDGNSAQAVGGLPVGPSTVDGASLYELSTGTVLAAEGPNAPMFFVLKNLRDEWDRNGGVGGKWGLPTSNPVLGSELRQDFEHGYVTLNPTAATPDGGPTYMWHEVTDPASELPGKLPDVVLHQTDGTSWYINKDGQRLWIPNGGTYVCLGAETKQLPVDYPGYAIKTIPYAGIAACG